MRMIGNMIPKTILIEPYHLKTGYVELRIRKNIEDISKDGVSLFKYDEYIFHLKDRKDLEKDVESNFSDWIATGRGLEVNENATIICELREEIKRLRGE